MSGYIAAVSLLCTCMALEEPSKTHNSAVVTGRLLVSNETKKKVKTNAPQVGTGFAWLESHDSQKRRVSRVSPEGLRPAHLALTDAGWNPRFLTVRTGVDLLVKVPGPKHWIDIQTVKNRRVGNTGTRNGEHTLIFKVEEPTPVHFKDPVTGNDGFLLIRKSPYMAAVDTTGRFTIRNVPPGKWNLVLWNEKVGWLKDFKIGGKQVKAPRGRLPINVQKGTLDIGKLLYRLPEKQDARSQ